MAAFRTYARLPENFAELRVGEFGYVRAVTGASFDMSPGCCQFNANLSPIPTDFAVLED